MHWTSPTRHKGGWAALGLLLAAWAAPAAAQQQAGAREPDLMLAVAVEQEKRPQRRPLDPRGEELDYTGWAFYLDNDALAPGNTDRDYTGGFSLTLSGAATRELPLSADAWLGALNGLLGVGGPRPGPRLHSIEWGFTAFTPENIRTGEPLADDRPYASLVYMTNTRQSIDPARRRSLVTSLTLGVLGLEVAPSIQNDLHRVLDFEPAQGWDHQISDGGELTARYGLAVQSMLYRDRGTGFASAEVQSTLKGNLGYLTDLGWNLSGRWGRLRSPWWSHGPQLSEFAEKSAPQAPRAAAQRPESYLWAGLGVRLRLYNAFLQGQFRHSAVTLDRARLRSWLAEAWLGYTHELPGGLRISYVLRGQTAEIKRGPAARRAAWGGLIVSQAF